MATTETPQRSDADSLRDAIRLILRSWPILLIAAVVAGGAAQLYAQGRQTQSYTAQSVLFFSTAPFGQVLAGNYTQADPARQIKTAVQLIQLPAVRARVAQRLGANGVGGNTSIVPTAGEDTNVLKITARSDSPRAAAAVANASAEAFLDYQRDLNASTVTSAQRQLDDQLRSAPSPSFRRGVLAKRNNLATIKTLIDNQVELVGRATVPTASSSTPAWQITGVAVLIGLLIGVAISLLRTPKRRGEAL